MKPIKKEDMPKLIVLIVLAVGIFGFGIMQILSMSSPSVAATPPGAAKGTESVVASAGGVAPGQDPAAGLTVPADPELDFLQVGPPTGGKDPFAPNGAAAPVLITSAPVPAPPASPLPSVVATNNKRSNLETLLGLSRARQNATNLDDLDGGKNGNPAPVVVELPAPAWSIAGIVLAERDSDGIKRGRDVAILRDGTGNRRFVTVGDPVDNGYHVTAVQSGGVEIRNKNRTAMIRLNASPENSSGPGAIAPAAGTNGATRAN